MNTIDYDYKGGVDLTSVLGKLICKEMGRKKYRSYVKSIKEKKSAEVFCDLYMELQTIDEQTKAEMLLRLLNTVHMSVWISKRFLVNLLFYLVIMVVIFLILPINFIMAGTMTMATLAIAYKLIEFLVNRYCDNDIRMILIYKSVLFHFLSPADAYDIQE